MVKNARMANGEMMREMQIAEGIQMSGKKKKNDARERRKERNRLK